MGKRLSKSNYSLKDVWSSRGELPTLTKWGVTTHLASQAWQSFRTAPFTSVLTFVTISISLAILGAFFLAIENFGHALDSTHRKLTLSFYIREDATPEHVGEIATGIRQRKEVSLVTIRSKDEALAIFRKTLGPQSYILEGLDGVNPLPASIEVEFHPLPEAEKTFQSLAELYKSDPTIELVQYNQGLLGQVGSVIQLFRSVGTFAVVVLLVITGFIIATTIKLALHSHRDEIQIMRLVGATDTFICIPYVIEGAVQGLLGAVTGLLLVFTVGGVLSTSIANNPVVNTLIPSFHSLSLLSSLAVLAVGIIIGVGGSFFTVHRFIVSGEYGKL